MGREAYPVIVSSFLYPVYQVMLVLLRLGALAAEYDLVIFTEQLWWLQVDLTVGVFWDVL